MGFFRRRRRRSFSINLLDFSGNYRRRRSRTIKRFMRRNRRAR